MNRWRVGEDRGSKKTDRCLLTGDRSFSWSQTINVSLIDLRNGNGSLLIIWYLLYESMGGYRLIQDSLRHDSLAKSVMDFRGYGEEFFW
jgi:hypothetical protein